MMRHLPLVLAAVALAAVMLLAFEQHRAIDRLRAELDVLREQNARAVPSPFAARAEPASTSGWAAAPRAARPADGTAAPAQAPARPAAPAAPRAPVSNDEIARVESAMLSLLETDRPELREKLRAVVQEQQEAIFQERQEVRRERWISRAESRLSELSGDAALSEQQKRAVVDVLLGNRDQMFDLMRNAETSNDYAALRETRTRLRAEADARVRELLTAPQYEAYKRLFADDDEDERRPRPR